MSIIAMRTRSLLLISLFGLLGLGIRPPQVAPVVFASPIQAACLQVTASTCKLHVDPFTIQIAPGERLQAFQLAANGQVIYDFRTDVSNPPAGAYTPSVVKLDFAATCGLTYTVNLLARDTGDPAFLNAGLAENVICPQGVFTILLPLVMRH